jgi:hypothetical protein
MAGGGKGDSRQNEMGTSTRIVNYGNCVRSFTEDG